MTLRAALLAALSCALLSTVALAADRGTSEEAIALWNKGKAYFDKNGAQATMAAMSDKNGGLVDRDLYIFCYNKDNKISAHGVSPKMVGLDANVIRNADRQGLHPGYPRHSAFRPSRAGLTTSGLIRSPRRSCRNPAMRGLTASTLCAVGVYK